MKNAHYIKFPVQHKQSFGCFIINETVTWFRLISFCLIHFQVVSMVSLTFILLSVLSLCFYSMLLHEHDIKKNTNSSSSSKYNINNSIETTYVILLIVLDVLCCTWFTTEFTLRFISAPNRTSFITEFMNVIDLLTIVPYFIHFAYTDANPITSYISDLPDEIKVISTLRLIRLFRFFRLSTGLQILKHTMIASSKELLLLLLLLTIPVAIFATIVYYCERKVSVQFSPQFIGMF